MGLKSQTTPYNSARMLRTAAVKKKTYILIPVLPAAYSLLIFRVRTHTCRARNGPLRLSTWGALNHTLCYPLYIELGIHAGYSDVPSHNQYGRIYDRDGRNCTDRSRQRGRPYGVRTVRSPRPRICLVKVTSFTSFTGEFEACEMQ